MSEHSIVSIIIPTKDRINLLKITLNSIFRQSYKDIEIVVINDGSKDETEKYCTSISNIRYIKNSTELSGPSRARNLGLKVARGQYIMFLDDDDLLHPEHIKEMVLVTKKLDPVLVPSSRWRLFQILGDGVFFGAEMTFKGEKNFSDAIAQMINPSIQDNIINSSFLWRKSQLEHLKWNEELFTNGDLDFYMQALMKNFRFYGVNAGYVYYRSHQGMRVAGNRSVKGLESSTRHRILWSEKLNVYKDDPMIRTAFCKSFMSLIINWLETGDESKIPQIQEMMKEWECRSCFLPIQPQHPVKAFIANAIISVMGFSGLKVLIQHMKKTTKNPGLSIMDDYHSQIINKTYNFNSDHIIS